MSATSADAAGIDGLAGDTIAAIATAAGVGGVGIVRLSGPTAIAIAADALGLEAAQLDRRVRLGWARDRAGQLVDQVLAFAMRAPASFTGEDVAELQGHGGPHNLARLLASVVERGARIAEPGEFTRRAVVRGKLDLIRAEALLEVIHAGSERAWRLAQANLGGRLGAQIAAIEQRALAVLAELEGWIDFPEQDLELTSAVAIDGELRELECACAGFVDGFRHGRAVSRGITVALVGPVNVGKSSLLNALVGRERALVGAEPGTTRDWLEVDDVWGGVAVTLVDTAGLRATDDAVEQRGIALGEARVEAADVVVVVNDHASAWDDGVRYGDRALVIRSKADLGAAGSAVASAGVTASDDRSWHAASGDDARRAALAMAATAGEGGSRQGVETAEVAGDGARRAPLAASVMAAEGDSWQALGAATAAEHDARRAALATSAATGEGLDELRRRVLAVAGVADQEGSEQAFVTTARQRELASAAAVAFAAALASRAAGRPPEIVAIELRDAATALAQLRGIAVGERVLDEVFARFCIGK